MPLIVTFKNGQQMAYQGEDIKAVFQSGVMGKIPVVEMSGFQGYLVLGEVRAVTLYPADKWEERVAADKKKADDDAALREKNREDAAKAASEAKAAQEHSVALARAAEAAWGRKPWPAVKRAVKNSLGLGKRG